MTARTASRTFSLAKHAISVDPHWHGDGPVELGFYPDQGLVAVGHGNKEIGKFDLEDFKRFARAVLGDESEEPRHEAYHLSAEGVTKIGFDSYVVHNRMRLAGVISPHGAKKMTIRPGGLEDNIRLCDEDGEVIFTLGLASIQAIAEDFGLKPGPKVEIEQPRADWLDAKVLRVDYDGEEDVVAVRDGEGDWAVHLDGHTTWVYDDKVAQEVFSNVVVVDARA